jgi:hypothetical protein
MVRSRLGAAILALAFACLLVPLMGAGCGGGDDGPAARYDTGAPGDGSTVGNAPTFAGIKSLVATGSGTLVAAWDPATDDITPTSQIAYRVYVATSVGGWDFARPTVTTPSGAANATISSLIPGATYSVVVHAVDGDGNEDANTKHLEAQTGDNTPPTFAGATSLVGVDAHTVKVSWNAASDDGTPVDKIVYRVFVTDTAGGENYATPSATSTPGATSANVAGLDEAKTYYAVVRAVDALGNVETNTHEVSGRTLDQTPPKFIGCSSATASGTAISLVWTAATDNVDPSSKIAYQIFQSKTAGGEDYTKPTYTSPPGATTFVAIGLAPSTKYFFVCRAVDTSGNADANRVERSATTGASSDVTAPSFGGLVSASPSGSGGIALSWAPATDDFTPASGIVYDIFLATTPGGEVYTAPTYTSPPGATSYTITGLAPATSYSIVVRARDAAGNEDGNTVEKTTTTGGDTTPPTFAGLVSATQTGPTTIRLTWAAATDDFSLPGAIRYRIYQGTSAGGESFTTPVLTTAGGATAAVVGGLTPAKKYFFVAHAVDEAGNEDANTVEKSDTTSADVTPPTFAGVASFTATSASTAVASWAPATDNVDPSSNIVYELFLATTSGGEPLLPTATTAPGATSYTFSALSPNTNYFVIVRARDTAGNVDSNTVEKTAKTSVDVTAPTFGGATGVTGAAPTTLTVNWLAATDDSTPPSGIKYLICMTTTALACNGAGFTTTASVVGATSYAFTALTPTTTYYFVVRAQDASGNTDNNSVQVSGITVSDSTPPVFGGLTSASATGASTILLSWTAATDNVSTPAQIVYDVYESLTPGGESFASAPLLTTAPGATSVTISSLTPGTTYYFVVRARDVAGNRDGNTVEKSATTPSDTTPPTFGGATGVTTISDSQLRVDWTAATDLVTPSSGIVYLLCWSTTTSCTTTFTVMATTAPGVTNDTVGGVGILTPNTSYSFVVRAKDAAGNIDSNFVVRTGTTAMDTTVPTWVGGPTVANVLADTVASSGQLTVSWTAATDDAWPSANIFYRLCWSTSSTGCNGGSFSAMQTTAPAATAATISGLTSDTLYYVWVRAVDASSNMETGNHTNTATTAVSYSNNVNAQIFSASNTVGGCNGGCHSPLWNYSNTVNVGVSSGCTGYSGNFITPGDTSHSLIYLKMTNTMPASGCGVQMPNGGPYMTNLQTMMQTWINQGAHNN